MRVPGAYLGAITAMNFSHHDVQEQVDIAALAENQRGKFAGGETFDIVTGAKLDPVPTTGRIIINVPALSARTVLIERTAH
jgi:hypothetical protein